MFGVAAPGAHFQVRADALGLGMEQAMPAKYERQAEALAKLDQPFGLSQHDRREVGALADLVIQGEAFFDFGLRKHR
jgi:hypothetical protein